VQLPGRLEIPRVALSTGAELSCVAAGCWRLVEQSKHDVARVEAFIDDCLALGITTFDHADIYGQYSSQSLFGAALRLRPALRERMQLVSKCGIAPVSERVPRHRVLHLDSSRGHIIESVEGSLRALGTEHLDLFLIHRPDFLTSCDEVAEAFTRLREQNKVRNFGVSNFSPSQFALLQSKLPFPLVTNQIELSVLETSALRDGTLTDIQLRDIVAMAWSPLAGGRLFSNPDNERVRAAIFEVAERNGVDPMTVAIAWILRLPGRIVPILGTMEQRRLAHAARACSLSLDRQDWYEIYTAAGNAFA
jgi:predicted oxidoreductase